jgi:sulfatase maturation enzyme AslB (radical SAM superfamily)
MRNSKYWDNFQERADETVSCIQYDKDIPVRRVAVFVTEKCQLKCKYCNHVVSGKEMSEACFDSIIKQYGRDAIIHITGGEPATVKWLYPYLIKYGYDYRFHLNTNALVLPPAKSVKRLKVSLDSHDAAYWNNLVGKDAFNTVLNHIKASIPDTVVSITYTMTKENYKYIPNFIEFSRKEFPGLYAIFFSVYKGTNERFSFSDTDIDNFFTTIKPMMDYMLDDESKALLNETITEKFRIMQGVRFPENKVTDKCYLSLSERVFKPDGSMSGCSHLIRDGISITPGDKHKKCIYGCNRRLVAFNEFVEKTLKRA